MKQLIRITCLLLAVALTGTVWAAQKQKPAGKKEEKVRHFNKVSSVDAAANTISINPADPKEDAKQYTVDSFTAITVNGKPGKLADVERGMKVDFSVSGDGKKVTKLDASDAPEDKADKKEAKKNKK